jgi:hypothetical protein
MLDLLAQVGSFAAIEPVGASSGLQREAVVTLVELVGRAEALLTSWIGAFDAAGVHTADGARTTGAWLASSCEIDRALAGALVHRASDLRSCPHLAAAFADGRLGPAKVRALLEARTGHPELFAEHEETIVVEVTPLTVAHARIVAARWKALAEATQEFEEAEAERERDAEREREHARARAERGDGADPERADRGEGSDEAEGSDEVGGGSDGERDEDRRAPGCEEDEPGTGHGPAEGDASDDAAGAARPGPGEPGDPADENVLRLVQTFQGNWVLDGALDPVTGAELAEAIEAFVDRQFRDGTWSASDGRSAGYRRAHALAELVRRGAVAATRHGDPRPSVIVRIDPATLAGIPAGSLLDGLDRECSLDDGTPIDPRSVERLLCTARIQALWTRIREDGSVETLGVTDLLRDATRAQRRALKQRDGRCVFPGCGAAAEWCDAHHLVPNEDLGPTLLANLVLLCRFHHHLVHEGGWTLWRDAATGALHLVDPQHRPRPIGQPGVKQPVLDPEALLPVRPPPPPPHLRPPRFRTASDPPGPDPGLRTAS